MLIEEAIKERTSANSYDPSRQLTDVEMTELIELATQAPSAFNLQNWKFIVVRSAEAKARLLPLAFGQPKVVEASATVIICGTLEPHLSLPAALKPTRDAGILDEDVYNSWVGAAHHMYGANATFQRDEAIRSGTLAAMTLMLAAQGRGLVSCPMIGFNASGVAEAFGLGSNELPVMLLTVGYPGPSNWPRKPRKAIGEVLALV